MLPFQLQVSQIACLLLSYGADPEIAFPTLSSNLPLSGVQGDNVTGFTPLQWVAYDGQYGLVAMMLKVCEYKSAAQLVMKNTSVAEMCTRIH